MSEAATPGTLSVIATPIGNLEDITYRAVRVLRECDYIVCEDTRVTGKLLAHYGIKTPLRRYDTHSLLQAK
jgi:16S rRNA (cytidine1402-2'-O)-methyltransferase